MLFSVNAQVILASLEHATEDEFVRLIRTLAPRLKAEIEQCPSEYERLRNSFHRALDLIKLYLELKRFRHQRALLGSLRSIPAYSALARRKAEYSARLRRARTRTVRQLRDVHELEAERLAAESIRAKAARSKGGNARAEQKRKQAATTKLKVKQTIEELRAKGVRTTAKQIAKAAGRKSPDYVRKLKKRIQAS